MKIAKRWISLIGVLCLFQIAYGNPEETYKQNKHTLKVDERLALAHQIVASSEDDTLLNEVLDEYLMFTWKEEKVNQALKAIDSRSAKANSKQMQRSP